MRCDQCKFWEAPDDEDEWDEVARFFGHCRQTPHGDDIAKFSEAKRQRVVRQDYADRTACALDAGGYYAHILTRAEHFCAMFKAAE